MVVLSLLWAAYNVEASSPEEYGGYYAWGETEEKESYMPENYKYYEIYYMGDGPYDWYYVGKFIGNEISGTSYDVAHVQWGGGARMPTLTEVNELVNNCTFKYGTYNGVRGNYVTGPNGNSIFLPFAGYWDCGNLRYGNYGYFWSGTYFDDYYGLDAYYLYCSKDYGNWRINNDRNVGRSVRPVTEKIGTQFRIRLFDSFFSFKRALQGTPGYRIMAAFLFGKAAVLCVRLKIS